MTGYELLYLIPSTRTQEEIQKIKEQVNQILVKEKVDILHHDIWLQRKLAYPIKKAEQAFYILVYFKSKGDTVARIKRALELSRDILRSCIIKHKDLEPQIKRFVEKQEPQSAGLRSDDVKEQKLPRSVIASKPARPAKAATAYDKPIAGDGRTDEQPSAGADKQVKPKKVKKKTSLADLDEKLEDLLGGEIEL